MNRYRLLKNQCKTSVSCKSLQLIQSMHPSTIASIAFGEQYPDAIEATIGLKQDDNIYINDLPLFLEKST